MEDRSKEVSQSPSFEDRFRAQIGVYEVVAEELKTFPERWEIEWVLREFSSPKTEAA